MDFKALQPLGWKPFFQNQIALDDDQTIVPLRVAEVRNLRLSGVAARQRA